MAASRDARVFRFAPSPNGEMHLGHALSALVGYERARACGGRFLVRIEDIDRGPLAAAVRRADLRRPRLARHRLGGAGRVPVAAHAGLPRGGATPRGDGPPLSLLCHARRDRGRGRRRVRSTPMARRSIPGSSGAAIRSRSRGGRRRASRSRYASTWGPPSRLRPPSSAAPRSPSPSSARTARRARSRPAPSAGAMR